jgi:hypothetical protein
MAFLVIRSGHYLIIGKPFLVTRSGPGANTITIYIPHGGVNKVNKLPFILLSKTIPIET